MAVKYGARSTNKDVAMGKAISAYLVNFARNGDPNGRGLPAWPRYRALDDEIMEFAASGKPEPKKDPWGEEIETARAAAAARQAR